MFISPSHEGLRCGQEHPPQLHWDLRVEILNKDKFNNVIAMARGSQGRPSVRGIEPRCRAALAEYGAVLKRYKEERKLLPFFPVADFYADK